MATTIWVDSEGAGDDGNSGISLALAKRTLSNAITALGVAGTGSTLNVVSRATAYPITTPGPLLSGMAGTSYTNFGFLIRGVNTSEDPAFAVIQWNASYPAFRIGSNTRYGIIRGLDFNRLLGTGPGGVPFVRIDVTNAGPVRVEECISRISNSPRNGQEIGTNLSNLTSFGEIRYCYYLVSGTDGGYNIGIDVNNSNNSNASFNNNVVVVAMSSSSLGGSARVAYRSNVTPTAEGANTYHSVTHNTFINMDYANLTYFINNIALVDGAAQTYFHSNVWASFSLPTIPIINSLLNSNNSTAFEGVEYPGTKLVGYNVVADITGSVSWSVDGPYHTPFDPDNSDSPDDPTQFWATDVVDPTNPFNASGTPWTWTNINNSGYSILLAGDYRLAIHRASGFGGTVPGAIADGIAVAVDDSYTFYNDVTTSVAAPGVLGNDTDVGSGTAVLVAGPSPLAGVLSLAANGSFTFTPVAGYQGPASFTYYIDTGTPSNTATVSLTIVSPVPVFPFGLPIGPDSPGFLFETPEGAGASIRLARNVVLEAKQLVSFVREQITHVGGGSAEIPTATALAAVPTLSGSRVLILESDGAATVRLNSVDVPLLAGGCVLLCGADLSAILVTNDHPVRPAVVRYFGGK